MKKYLISIIAILVVVTAVASIRFLPLKKTQEQVRPFVASSALNLTYNQVVDSKLEEIHPTIYKSKYDGVTVQWNARISSYYSQITGIKFCVVDGEHNNINIDEPCDWFWASSGDTMNADNIEVNPNWDGRWVPYILNYYKVPFNEKLHYYNEAYTVKGMIDGIDCGMGDKCIPNIEILSIAKE